MRPILTGALYGLGVWCIASAALCAAYMLVMGAAAKRRDYAPELADWEAHVATTPGLEPEYAEHRERLRLELCADAARVVAEASDLDAELAALTGGGA